MREQVSDSQKQSEYTVLFIIFIFLDSRWRVKKLWTDWLQEFSEINLLSISSRKVLDF